MVLFSDTFWGKAATYAFIGVFYIGLPAFLINKCYHGHVSKENDMNHAISKIEQIVSNSHISVVGGKLILSENGTNYLFNMKYKGKRN